MSTLPGRSFTLFAIALLCCAFFANLSWRSLPLHMAVAQRYTPSTDSWSSLTYPNGYAHSHAAPQRPHLGPGLAARRRAPLLGQRRQRLGSAAAALHPQATRITYHGLHRPALPQRPIRPLHTGDRVVPANGGALRMVRVPSPSESWQSRKFFLLCVKMGDTGCGLAPSLSLVTTIQPGF
jgi:hypothetical protein